MNPARMAELAALAAYAAAGHRMPGAIDLVPISNVIDLAKYRAERKASSADDDRHVLC